MQQSEDIVFSCPQMPYAFDEALYLTQGMGGSETALFEMARHLRQKTKRHVRVFKQGENSVANSGVEYLSTEKTEEYFRQTIPKVHIAWRHNRKLTNARTFLWCHDLLTATVEVERNFDVMLCLSDFHKTYVHRNQFVPSRKIVVSRNGIDPAKFAFERSRKNENKIVWMSSPDRGLRSALLVMDVVTRRRPKAELHVYYGFHLLRLYGMEREADELEEMLKQRPYVRLHGFTEQLKMYKEIADAVIWLYPCNYLETFCITALEMQALGIFPVTRRHGALAETLREAEQKGNAILLDYPRIAESDIQAYAAAVFKVLDGRMWENVSLDLERNSWSAIADEWIRFMNLA
jgi:glycosyltransferase involved in cell wall biosynthesis